MFNRIEKGLWWDEGIKLISGCTKVSEGCENCWALAMDNRFDKTIEVKFHVKRLKRFEKKKPTVYAIWNDLFHAEVSESDIVETWNFFHNYKQHKYLILTKRPERMKEIITDNRLFEKNVWLGTTVENQRTADERIPLLFQTPARKRFLSVEPMLGKIDISPFCDSEENQYPDKFWVIIGCESGAKRRETKTEWVESLVGQCKSADIPVFVKQLEVNGVVEKDINKFPENLQLRELPKFR